MSKTRRVGAALSHKGGVLGQDEFMLGGERCRQQGRVEGGPGEGLRQVAPNALLVISAVTAHIQGIVAASHRRPELEQVQHELALWPANQTLLPQSRQNRGEVG